MTSTVPAYEKIGAFYLGREHHPGEDRGAKPLVLYDSKDLVTHAVCVGKTGKLAELQTELEGDLRELENRFDPELEELETVTVRPRKSDVEVRLVALAWDPR